MLLCPYEMRFDRPRVLYRPSKDLRNRQPKCQGLALRHQLRGRYENPNNYVRLRRWQVEALPRLNGCGMLQVVQSAQSKYIFA